MHVKIREKAQVTIPAAYVRQVNLKPGDVLDLTVKRGTLVFVKVGKKAG